jgi:GTP-binding protein
MKIKEAKFLLGAMNKTQFPQDALPEFAFAGRSNVGKSSLINMLLGRHKLAKTSSTPGKTATINFYLINNEFRIVDLPGYGYAKVSKSMKKSWGNIIEQYLGVRENLLEVFLLVDIRHKPSKDDIEMYQWIKRTGYNGLVIATKADKLTRNEQQKMLSEISLTLEAPREYIIPISSEKRTNKYEVWGIINDIFELNNFDIKVERQVDDSIDGSMHNKEE